MDFINVTTYVHSFAILTFLAVQRSRAVTSPLGGQADFRDKRRALQKIAIIWSLSAGFGIYAEFSHCYLMHKYWRFQWFFQLIFTIITYIL